MIVILLAALAQAEPTATAPIDDVVVTAPPGAPRPLLDAAGYFRRHCFDGLRRGRAAAPPTGDADWVQMGTEARRRLRLSDPAATAHGLVDPGADRRLILTTETLARPGSLVERRCTLVVIGGRDHAGLADQLSSLFRGPGTERHVGHPEAKGHERLPGWRQRAWTAIPARGSRDWRAHRSRDADSLGFVRVVDDRLFYAGKDFVLADLKSRDEGPPLSVLSLAWTTRATEKGGPDRDRPSTLEPIPKDQKSR